MNQMLREYIASQSDRNEKVVEYHPPEELRSMLNLNPPEKGVTLQQLLYDCATTLKYCVKTGHPHCYSYLLCGFDVFSMAGEWLTATANAK
jgi:glutamate decarboxylase